eukprot:760124-Hanusia_phi.AAC.6
MQCSQAGRSRVVRPTGSDGSDPGRTARGVTAVPSDTVRPPGRATGGARSDRTSTVRSESDRTGPAVTASTAAVTLDRARRPGQALVTAGQCTVAGTVSVHWVTTLGHPDPAGPVALGKPMSNKCSVPYGTGSRYAGGPATVPSIPYAARPGGPRLHGPIRALTVRRVTVDLESTGSGPQARFCPAAAWHPRRRLSGLSARLSLSSTVMQICQAPEFIY